jgi:glycine dehydrogenase subunit 2
MKHNPRLGEKVSALPGFAESHPMAPSKNVQGNLAMMWTLQEWLKEITGLAAVTLHPAAGAHGELTGVLLIRAYHISMGSKRSVMLIPDSAHGTNPATAAMAGYQCIEVPSQADGTISFEDVTDGASGKPKKGLLSLIKEHGAEIAGIMITNPNTVGIFEYRIAEIAKLLHQIGALLYMDGANMNALMGVSRPGDFGIDVMHLNLHKTFGTPHGGGGPGSGPVACSAALEPFLPRPIIIKASCGFDLEWNRPQSIGKMHSYFGNFAMEVRALAFCMSHGSDGLRQATMRAIVNANYIRRQLEGAYHLQYSAPTLHEVVFDDAHQSRQGISTLDIAKGLIDRGFHPPTIYFPLVIHGAMMIEPTESESKAELDAFIEAMLDIAGCANSDPDSLKQSPTKAPVRRLDETVAARKPVLRWTDNTTQRS